MEARIQLRFLGYMGKLCIYLKIRFNCAKVFGCGYLGVQQNRMKICTCSGGALPRFTPVSRCLVISMT